MEEEMLDNLNRDFREILKPYIGENMDIEKVINSIFERAKDITLEKLEKEFNLF